jgi:hypothetical protein
MTYDIFAGGCDNEAIWLAAEEEFESAQERICSLAAIMPGPYFVFCQETQRVVVSVDTTTVGAEQRVY